MEYRKPELQTFVRKGNSLNRCSKVINRLRENKSRLHHYIRILKMNVSSVMLGIDIFCFKKCMKGSLITARIIQTYKTS